ncbi:hypothetical protein L593_02865 [Salinarchaeum sp. Harcht-Bsk1]|nr:hypothetical protein [Salinarchaeum sp. Harcht-Bsk1]AGN00524.1 hypothetical protein L593_02865 [Salinarchaeum sp. Harcht-Bsk1]
MAHLRHANQSDCPQCGATTLNVQGLADCPQCSWLDPADGN